MLAEKKEKLFLIGIVFYVLCHFYWFLSHGILLNVDSNFAYIPQSKIAFFSKEFFIGGNYLLADYGLKARAFAYPLYLKLFGTSIHGLYLATLAQFLMSLLTWSTLALTVANRMRTTTSALLSFFVILLMSLTNTVIVWDHIIAAESLTISFFLLIIILYFKWSDTEFKFNGYYSAMILISLFFAYLRDTNPYFLVLLSLFILSILIFLKRDVKRGPAYLFFAVCVACFLVNNAILEKTNRWQLPFSATFVGRLMCQSDQSALNYFQEKYHMPQVPDTLKPLAGTIYGWDYALAKTPLTEWMNQQGKTAYTHYLMTHPYYSLIVPWLSIKQHFNRCLDLTKSIFNIRSGYRFVNHRWYEIDYQRSLWFALLSTANFSVDLHNQPVTSWLTILLIPLVDLIALCALVGACWLVVFKKSVRKELISVEALFYLFLLFSGIFLSILIWHADSTAYARHLVVTGHQIILSAFLLFFFLYDKKEVP